ncbi:MAG: phosphoribosylamine--glycine ligase [Christensenellales bacterium]
MKVLVVGGGGREHAIIWKLKQSKRVDKLYCAPGNGGIAQDACCVDIQAKDIDAMVAYAKKEGIDFCVVAPDDPLAMGMVDAMEASGILCFGPSQKAAMIESSKVFAKDLMKQYGIPTAGYGAFTDAAEAKKYAREIGYPVVVKADGLALGKGVIICEDEQQADRAIEDVMVHKLFGEAGQLAVIEEFMTGPEVSVLCFTDGVTIRPMISAQDHKRAFDDDMGPNTGGMGAFAPSMAYTPELAAQVETQIMRPTVDAMMAEGRKFKGVLYFGLMLTKEGPKVLEYNARFGDPETQAVLPMLKNDLMEIFLAVAQERLHEISLQWAAGSAVCIVMASGGYPMAYKTGYPIHGIEQAVEREHVWVFHAGTKVKEDEIVTTGGRVLGVTACGESHDDAIRRAYAGVDRIQFKDMYFRKDIGIK